jgi:hypothetical protein
MALLPDSRPAVKLDELAGDAVEDSRHTGRFDTEGLSERRSATEVTVRRSTFDEVPAGPVAFDRPAGIVATTCPCPTHVPAGPVAFERANGGSAAPERRSCRIPAQRSNSTSSQAMRSKIPATRADSTRKGSR